MEVCSHCSESLPPENDYVTCGVCKSKYHYACSSVRETAWRNFSAGAKLSWKCNICKIKTATDNDKPEVNSECLLNVKTTSVENTGTDSDSGGSTGCNEIGYLKELLRHKDLLIQNQADLIQSLKDQIQLLKLEKARTLTRPQAKDLTTVVKPTTGAVHRGAPTPDGITKNLNTGKNETRSNEQVKSKTNVRYDGLAGKTSQVITNYDVHEALTRTKINELLNLASTSNDDEQWKTVTHKKPKQTVIGKKLDDGKCKLRAAETFGYWHVYRLHPDTSAEDVKAYLESDFPGVQVEKLKSFSPTVYSSFKVTVREKDEQRILDAGLWPSGTRINRFFHSRDK